jgi:hypothetical protein
LSHWFITIPGFRGVLARRQPPSTWKNSLVLQGDCTMSTSNPVFIRLSDLVGQTVFAQAVTRFDKENLEISSTEWEAHPAKMTAKCEPGSFHLGGLPYELNVQRRSDGVWGVCSCAADRLCKHLAGGYLAFTMFEKGHASHLGGSCPGCACPPPPPPPPTGGRILEPSKVLKRKAAPRKQSRETKEIARQVDAAIEKDLAVAVLDRPADPWENDHFCGCGAVTFNSDRCDVCQAEKDRSDIFGY